MKKMIGVIMLTIALVCGDMLCEAEELSEGDLESIIEELDEIYGNDPEFYREAIDKGLSYSGLINEYAESLYYSRVDLMENESLGVYSLGNNRHNMYAYVPLIKQTNNYNCGPTSILQIITGMGRQGLIQGTTNEEKISTLMSDCATTSNGTYVYKVKDTINLYSSSTYAYYDCTNITLEAFQSKVETSLYYDKAPIIHAKTMYLPYYNGHDSGHYIALSEVDMLNSKIKLVDCNRNNSYYGIHQESVQSVYDAVHEQAGRYLICLQY